MNDDQYKLIIDGAKRRGAKFPTTADWLDFKKAIDAAVAKEAATSVVVVPAAPTPACDDAFPPALKELLKHEGGYVNHPSDPGGRTNLGVTQRVWEAWTGKRATEAAMRALTPEAVAPLYRKHYWNAVQADELPGGLALNVFDFGVNAGPKRAVQFLQQLAGTMVDGVIGPMTVAAVRKHVAKVGEAAAIRAYSELRRHYYRTRKTFPTFGKGWLRRVNEVEAAALKLVDA